MSGVSNRAGADQLVALLVPDTAGAGEDPRRSGVRVVARAAHDGGVAIGRQSDGDALSCVSNRAGADQLVALLGPDTAAAGEDPRRADIRLSKGPPTMVVLPSSDKATEKPWPSAPTAPVPTNLLPC